MGKIVITLEVGNDIGRIHRVVDEIVELVEDAGYCVEDYEIQEEVHE